MFGLLIYKLIDLNLPKMFRLLIYKLIDFIYGVKTLDIDYKFWPTNQCWDCKIEVLNLSSCWYKFVEINKQVYQVPMCDKCAPFEILYDKVNFNFREILSKKFYEKFQVKLETYYSFIGLCLVSKREDDLPLRDEQKEWINGFELGYIAAMEQINEIAN